MLELSDVVIGTVVGPFGNKGEIKVRILTDFPQRFAAGRTLNMVSSEGDRISVRLNSFRSQKNVGVAKLAGYNDRTMAESLRGADFVVDRSEVEELPEGSHYIYELEGCNVVTQDGRELGFVKEVVQGGANDVYVTSENVCIPAIKQVIVDVDVVNKVIVINPMAGMLED